MVAGEISMRSSADVLAAKLDVPRYWTVTLPSEFLLIARVVGIQRRRERRRTACQRFRPNLRTVVDEEV